MKEKFKGFIYGCIVTSMLTGSVAYAATSTSIEVYFKNLKYKIDGVDKVPTEGKGFIYDGTTYVPLRFIGESLGKSVAWDGETETIWVGKKDGKHTELTSLKFARYDAEGNTEIWTDAKEGTINVAGVNYQKGISGRVYNISSSEKKASIDYNVNGKYKKLTAIVGMDDASKNAKTTGTIRVIGDGKELKVISNLRGGDNASNIEVDVTNVLKLQIVFEADFNKNNNVEKLWIDFLEPKLYE
ncbi:hypothetical protein GC102_24330 [Paenibacillus sp. LMG 31460]|uniref:Glycosyl hydrolase family 98 putative carbohydrate-binding module domain-containing protein n=1 Tax=Paenibacillus germinis TaxID=2654979 RepID=A0ABX1Z6E5_9BACL|nr:NPCBM/NEW2 domain-containing protein [Paenibacillus germinis]NOU88852.1 hypothetical protein [Paenibacillus germinis]